MLVVALKDSVDTCVCSDRLVEPACSWASYSLCCRHSCGAVRLRYWSDYDVGAGAGVARLLIRVLQCWSSAISHALARKYSG